MTDWESTDRSSSLVSRRDFLRMCGLASEPPWITTRLISVSSGDADTWDPYEKALSLQGRRYYTGAALLEVSAGGNFDYGYVDLQTTRGEIIGVTLLRGKRRRVAPVSAQGCRAPAAGDAYPGSNGCADKPAAVC